MLVNIFDGIHDLDAQSKKSIRDVLVAMLQPDPAKRITLDEAIERFPSGPTPKGHAPHQAASAAAASSLGHTFFVSETVSSVSKSGTLQSKTTTTVAIEGHLEQTLVSKHPLDQHTAAAAAASSSRDVLFASKSKSSISQPGSLQYAETSTLAIEVYPAAPTLMPKTPAVQHFAAAASSSTATLFASKSTGAITQFDSLGLEDVQLSAKKASEEAIEETESMQSQAVS